MDDEIKSNPPGRTSSLEFNHEPEYHQVPVLRPHGDTPWNRLHANANDLAAVTMVAVGTLLGWLAASARLAIAQDKTTATPGFNNKIPEQVLTPDTVQTRIGTLKFFDGLPTDETVQKVYDHLDFIRGVDVFLNFIPATSMEAIRRGLTEVGVAKSNQAILFDQLMDWA